VVLQRTLVQTQRGWQADARRCQNVHVPVALGDVDGSGARRIALLSFLDLQRTTAVEPLGKKLGKQLGHVLHYQDRQREVRRQRGKQNLQGSRAAGRDAIASATGVDEIC